MNARKKFTVAILATTTTTMVAIVVLVALLPAYLDEFLLTNDDFCYRASSSSSSLEDLVSVDGMRRRATNSILRRISTRLWENLSAGEDDDPYGKTTKEMKKKKKKRMTAAHPPPDEILEESRENANPNGRDDDEGRGGGTTGKIHPLCRGYRDLRSRARFAELSIPWMWYLRTEFRLRGLALRSSTTAGVGGGAVVAIVPGRKEGGGDDDARTSYTRWMMGWIAIGGGGEDEDDASRRRSQSSSSSPSRPTPLPPSLEIETMDVSIRSAWSLPVVSARLRGITINVVVRKGEFPLFNRGGVDGGSSIMIGDMTVREALDMLPRPPEAEGTYPRIGIVNVSDVTLCVHEKDDGVVGQRPPSLKMLLKIGVPDEFFLPITDMTLAHERDGIDRKHFQPMAGLSISDALRRHLLQEATAAFRNSWLSAHRAHEQLQQLVLQTQELYLDRWIDKGARALRQGVVDGASPMIRAMEDWLVDVRDIFTEPIPPLAVVLSHHCNRTVDGINKHSISMDRQLWEHLNDMANNLINFKREKAISKHLNDLRVAVDGFIAKSGQDIELLVKSFELELKEMWLRWHRQYPPELSNYELLSGFTKDESHAKSLFSLK